MTSEERRRRDRERQRAYRAADPEGTRARVRAQRAADPLFWKRYEFARLLRRKYDGMLVEDWARMFHTQEGRCRLCLNSLDGAKGTHVDHDHVSGRVRALLCTQCNVCIGMAREDRAVLRRMMDYLEA